MKFQPGEDNINTTLPKAFVDRIQSMHTEALLPVDVIANRLSVHPDTIRNILDGKTWKETPDVETKD